jgi:cyclic pyranopterin phosphate synthase
MKNIVRDNKLHTYGVEVRAAEHCNLRCKGCSQNSPFMPATFPDLSRLQRSLAALEKVLRADRVTVLGGEPLLNPNIDKLLVMLKTSKVFNRVFVTTNGLLLHRMSPEFWRLVDVVEISVYPVTKARLQRNFSRIADAAFAGNVELRLLASPAFKHVVLSSPIASSALVEGLYEACYFKDFCNTLRDERFYKCAPCINIGARLSLEESTRMADDGILIEDAPDMLDRLVAYLDTDRPLVACAREASSASHGSGEAKKLQRVTCLKPFQDRRVPLGFAV